MKEDMKMDKKDNINPDHYKSQTSLECIEAMRMAFGDTAVSDFCICNAWKYIWRWKNKNGKEDLKKAMWYLEVAEERNISYRFHDTIDAMREYIEGYLGPKNQKNI